MDPAPPRYKLSGSSTAVVRRFIVEEICILGIDLAKRVFQLHGADRQGRTVYTAKVMRAAFLETVRESRPRIIAMEACGMQTD